MLFIATQRATAAAIRAACVVAEAGAECTVIEEYVGARPETPTSRNAVTEIVVGPNARVRAHPAAARERPRVSYRDLRGRASRRTRRYTSQTVTLGARLSR